MQIYKGNFECQIPIGCFILYLLWYVCIFIYRNWQSGFFSIAVGKNTFSTCNSVIHLFSFLLDMYLKLVEFEDFFLSENPRTSSKSMAKNYIKRYIVPENHHLHPGAPWPSIERSPFLPLEKCPFIKDYLQKQSCQIPKVPLIFAPFSSTLLSRFSYTPQQQKIYFTLSLI